MVRYKRYQMGWGSIFGCDSVLQLYRGMRSTILPKNWLFYPVLSYNEQLRDASVGRYSINIFGAILGLSVLNLLV